MDKLRYLARMNSGFALVVLALVCALSSVAQDTLFFSIDGEEMESFELCDYYRLIDRSNPDTNMVVERDYFKSGLPKKIATFSPYELGTLHGPYKIWYESGQLKFEAVYNRGELDGTLVSYWDNGQMKRKESYVDGTFNEGQVWDVDGNELTYYPQEIFPEFPGGDEALLQFLGSSIRYPKKAFKSGVQGRVVVSFTVEQDGSISNIFVMNGVSKELDQEAVRVVSTMPRWSPGMQDGVPVRVQYRLPITFRKTKEG